MKFKNVHAQSENVKDFFRSVLGGENKSLTFSDTNNINERLQDIHKIQCLKLREKQRKKLFRDDINPNKNRSSFHFWGNDKSDTKIYKAESN